MNSFYTFTKKRMINNPELDLAYKFVHYTNKNIFLTGKAGTGKTTFLRSLKHNSFKRMIVVAPTGVAAINAQGVTMHSFFQLPFGPIITEKAAGKKVNNPNLYHRFSKTKINIIKTLDLLIIDEISMVRADVLDAVDEVLRRYKNRYKPFGGVQLLMIGDLQQLAPVVKKEDSDILSPYYRSMFFFNSKALQETDYITVELKHIYRQKDNEFLKILNEIRNDELSRESFKKLHSRYIPDFKPDNNNGYITLTTHNANADRINQDKLNKIDDITYVFDAEIEGTFSEYAYPTDFELKLKPGAQVMYVKNDSSPDKRYYNGKIGKIIKIEDEDIYVECKDETEIIKTGKERWENIKYTINKDTKEIEEEFIGAFIQYPLKLAWAITIHKSQGLTFEKAVIDASAAFAHGQTYVALSRCKTLEGLVLSSRISEDAVICNTEVNAFNRKNEQNKPDENKLNSAIYTYQAELIKDLFNYKQLNYRAKKFEQLLRVHAGTYTGDIGENILTVNKNSLPKIEGIAGTFLKQVDSLTRKEPDLENNHILKDRLIKASEYFLKFHNEEIKEKLRSGSFESDNISVIKEIQEAGSAIYEILNVKDACLEVCLEGFHLKNFLSARAKALLEENSPMKKSKVAFKETKTRHPELYAELKAWRLSEAGPGELPLYMIVSNKALHAIANELPATLNQLKTVPGIGNKKIEQYGNTLISIVSEYIKKKGLKAKKDIPEAKKTSKKKNWEISYEMYKEGKTIAEIAEDQGFVVRTIENHLCRYIATGEINVEEFVKKDIVELISDYFKKHPESLLSVAKEALPENITYSDIKFVQQHLEFINNQN